MLQSADLLQDLKFRHNSLRSFLEKSYDNFEIIYSDEIYPDFMITLSSPNVDEPLAKEVFTYNQAIDDTPQQPVELSASDSNQSMEVGSNHPAEDDTLQTDVEDSSIESEIANDLDLKSLSISSLKSKLREASLPVSGNKAELIARLEAQHASPSRMTEVIPQVAPTFRIARPELPEALIEISDLVEKYMRHAYSQGATEVQYDFSLLSYVMMML